VWFNGRTSAFQADNAGSIPVTRSIKHQARSLKLLAFLVQRTVSIISCEIVFGRFGMLLIAWRGAVAFAFGQTYGSPAI
jgi:hypothetical protein